MVYSPFSLPIESSQIKLLNMARKLSVAVVAYSPLSHGRWNYPYFWGNKARAIGQEFG
ncbi:hypothetical protein FVEG_17425 [Fusarium verticillioides 7600]|uniref:NADP-dependent oxidoreductase domain-containing protein n=1 Tax=Gibberella moniliformis (strain M3125 / FGSC 7600) TaxID=334819 RepID=W7N4C9_GIBM7|nr:hypothetical protein FVEG_17425 [Fusarium verticillioides 7600]EWG54935.1 hypothetical protein FVEG_17425 [Fusarium verticillioides 7600]